MSQHNAHSKTTFRAANMYMANNGAQARTGANTNSNYAVGGNGRLNNATYQQPTAGGGYYPNFSPGAASNTYPSHYYGASAQTNQHNQQYYGTNQANNYYNPQYQYGPQQGYHTMDYSQWANQQYGNQGYNYQYPPGYDQYAQQPQQYQPTPPQIRNPFAPPPPARSQYTGQNAHLDPDYEAQVAQWQSAYAPQDQSEKGKKGGKNEKGENPNLTSVGARQGPAQSSAENGDLKGQAGVEKQQTVVRKGGGQTWQDDSLLEWDPTQFRIMVGNLAGEVTDDSLAKAFAQYGVSKARVVRDKRTTKSRGYGFVSFTDGDLGFKAAREMTGKYIGSHPVTIQRSKTDVRAVNKNDKNKKNHNKKKDKGGKKQDDPLKANTGAHIEKKPAKNPSGYKLLG